MKFPRSKVNFIVLIASFCFPLEALAANESGWTLTQVASGSIGLGGGGQTLCITPNGMRSTDPKNGISMFTRGPSWNVVLLNSQTRKYFQTPLKSWLESFRRRNIAGKFDGVGWRKGSFGTVCGTRAYEYLMDHPPSVRTNAGPKRGQMGRSQGIKSANLWVATDIVTPPQASAILSQMYGLPDCQRIPLRVTVTDLSGRTKTVVDTVKVQRVTVPESQFTVPSGYSPVKSDMEILMDKESMDSFNDIMKDLDAAPTPSQRPGQRR